MAHVLIVDDHQEYRSLASYLLRSAGHDVTTVSSAPSALAAAFRRRPDLALVDVHLPGIGGVVLARTLRRNPGMTGVPLIAWTVSSGPVDLESLLTEGVFDGRLDDKINAPTFAAAVERCLPCDAA